jgi:Sulfatase-modifying factor enzyme 1/Novel STAND NTPase 1
VRRLRNRGALPLVAYALKQLFDRKRERTFTREAYKEISGVAGAIGTAADQVIKGLNKEALGAFDKVFAELVHIERDRPPTRKLVTLATFKTDEGANELINALAGQECRVLVTGGDTRELTVEVAHEKLFTAWPKLNEWINKGSDALRLIDHATEAARRWHEGGENPQENWLATRTTEVVTALQRFGKQASPVLNRFLRPQEVLIKQLEQDSLAHDRRALIGRLIAKFGDPRKGVSLRPDGLPDIEWVDIPAGTVKLEGVKRPFDVNPFRISRYVVTNMQFESFIIAEDGYFNRKWWKGIEQSSSPNSSAWLEDNCPRTDVSWCEVMAFCHWLSERLGMSIRLPTEWEWQQVATGGDAKNVYPWGSEWDAARCNSQKSEHRRTTAVGVYPKGATRQDVMDMAGNVWEWCLNKYGEPGTPESLRMDNDNDGQRVLRGGSWGNEPEYLRTYYRNWNYFDKRDNYIGFRLAQDLE